MQCDPTAPQTPPAEYINNLKITGRLHAKARGKERLFAICNSTIRTNVCITFICCVIHFSWYYTIVSRPMVPRGELGQAFSIPDEYIDGPLWDRVISIQAALIRPNWTLVFVDHNSIIQFHFMHLSPSFSPADMQPGSQIWPLLWNANHGPVYSQEPDATLAAFELWRAKMRRKPFSSASIFSTMKTYQTVFNGSGAQEATDLLFLALIHPQMLAFYICKFDCLWDRFVQANIDYDQSRMDLALSPAALPYTSGPRPFHFNSDGHKRNLSQITSYRCSNVILTADRLYKAHELGLFVPNAVIQPDGTALVPPNSVAEDPSVTTVLRAGRGKVIIPNYAIGIHAGQKDLMTYSPFTAQAGFDWTNATRSTVGADVRQDVNDTTLGLYSFRIFLVESFPAVLETSKELGTPTVNDLRHKKLPNQLP
ncbi:hypothetical protein DFH07DRAFT_966800 [Mycena maculata]|uniref:Uncharacterized protein n=1 Tax=Mycena maculata TaxID=230809 RepID=A0AAD7I8Y7_9AGAR|nr:hypothetical protein DFH07DRAFT_966800 [Mycena maculata]